MQNLENFPSYLVHTQQRTRIIPWVNCSFSPQFFFFLNLLVTCWLAVGRLSVTCRSTVGQSADRFFGELFFTITIKIQATLVKIKLECKTDTKLIQVCTWNFGTSLNCILSYPLIFDSHCFRMALNKAFQFPLQFCS